MAINPIFTNALQRAKNGNKRIHLLGLLSDGGVHSHIQHLFGLIDLLHAHEDVEVYIHAFLDGRDTDPKSGEEYLIQLKNHIRSNHIHIASVIGRYYAMDRDKRWERVRLAYDLLVRGKGTSSSDLIQSVREQYISKITDEFMPPLLNEKIGLEGLIKENDMVFFYNFRTDRPRQLTEALTQRDFSDEGMQKLNLDFITFTQYDQSFEGIDVIFQKENLNHTLGQVIAEAGLTQVRIAETEKYPHVTFFFNGGEEGVFKGEERMMIPSPKVATYDLLPEMSAPEITTKLIRYIDENKPHFICLNYANTDMVGHTGDFHAAVKATETVDACLGNLLRTLDKYQYTTLIIADHGNSDIMINPDGSPNTAHTTNPVPIILANNKNWTIVDGKLADIAPSILTIMGIDIPKSMTGNIILIKH
jgi:2,3-bisphosphoglycerate-independent phosphoglycerate mutase